MIFAEKLMYGNGRRAGGKQALPEKIQGLDIVGGGPD